MDNDIRLLCLNARRYNQETSQIHIDSIELEKGYNTARALLGEVGVAGSDEEEEYGSQPQQMTNTQSSSTSSVHVVEIESYASDNSDGEGAWPFGKGSPVNMLWSFWYLLQQCLFPFHNIIPIPFL